MQLQQEGENTNSKDQKQSIMYINIKGWNWNLGEREKEMNLYDVNLDPNEPKKNRTNVEKKLNSTWNKNPHSKKMKLMSKMEA
jgi:hypothetical protein